MKFYDAHRHWQQELDISCCEQCVVNGTEPDDWEGVIAAAGQHPQLIPAIGLHPWRVNKAPSDWRSAFLEQLPQAAAIGEIGLDRWIDTYDADKQADVFIWQLRQASQHNLPVSIHCLKASDALLRILKAERLPARGIHLHAYSGSAEQVTQFVKLGAYFSFHAGQLCNNAKKAPAALRAVPADRLLIETDAPDTLKNSDSHQDFLAYGYRKAASLRGIDIETLAKQVATNFKRYFLTS